MPSCLIGMGACVGAHHLSRKLKALGHDARLMPAKYVRPYSKGQKNDFRDAEAIAEAVQRPTMKFVATKTADQLDLQALHRVRERLVSQRDGGRDEIARALISMVARSNRSNQRPMQDRSPLARRKLLQRTAGPYIASITSYRACASHFCSCPHKPTFGGSAKSVETGQQETNGTAAKAVVAVGTRVSSRAPRTEPYVRLSRIRLPPRVCDGKAITRPCC